MEGRGWRRDGQVFAGNRRRKKSGGWEGEGKGGEGGVDLCQIKLKPPLSPHLSFDAGHWEYGSPGIRGIDRR